MVDKQALSSLRQGAKAWNQWRSDNQVIWPDLRGVHLNEMNLKHANLGRANLYKANLSKTNLRYADLHGVDLRQADLRAVNLSDANLSDADLEAANLERANLCRADLTGADLERTNLERANLAEADLSAATIGWTIFGDVDLSDVKGLTTIKHQGPSTIGLDTIYRSQGNIPEQFLRDAGVPDNFITYMASLTGKAFDFYSCFISYASQDHALAQRLHADLQSRHIRCWFAPEDMKIGAELRQTIDQTIRLFDKLLIILSEHSVNSRWVQKEVETAFEEEQRRNQQILFPIRLDDTVLTTDRAWAADIRRMRHIGDFTHWKTYEAYQIALDRLLRDLAKSEA